MFSPRHAAFLAFLLASVAVRTESARAEFIQPDGLPQPRIPSVMQPGEYVFPNEPHPIEAVPLLSRAPEGVHASAGTERSFLGFSINPKASHLLILDVDPEVISYAKINTALLAISKPGDTRDILALRQEDNHDVILKRISESGLNLPEFENLRNATQWTRFRHYLERPKYPPEHYLEIMPDFVREAADSNDRFAGVNYTKFPEQLRKLQTAARAGKIQSIQVDLGNNSSAKKIAVAIERQGLKLSTLDLSNAWWPGYMNSPDAVIRAFDRVARPDSIVVLTGTPGPGTIPETSEFLQGRHFYYFGYTFGEIREHPAFLRGPSLRKTIALRNPEKIGRQGVHHPTTLNGKPLLGTEPETCLNSILRTLLGSARPGFQAP